MGQRKITIKRSAATSIAEVAWYIESKGLVATAEKFSDSVYDSFEKLASVKVRYRTCKDPKRARLGFKCVNCLARVRVRNYHL